jgi:hypothetical protein
MASMPDSCGAATRIVEFSGTLVMFPVTGWAAGGGIGSHWGGGGAGEG